MTELETMQRAKLYLDKLANGIDPLTDQPVPEGDCINQVRISRCLFYVSDVLRQVIEKGGITSSRPADPRIKKRPFAITAEQLAQFPYSKNPIPVSEITKRINALVDTENMKKLSYKSIVAYLLKAGFLEEVETASGKMMKRPTDEGSLIGVWREERIGENGNYYVVVYNTEAQHFILDNMEAILRAEQ